MPSSNSQKYCFEDFTQASYRKLVKLAAEHHLFQHFHDFEKGSNFVLWRHDIDFSIKRTMELATIEVEEGVTSTWFVLPHSEYYNLLEINVTAALKSLIQQGHQIGLHFDAAYYNIRSVQELGAKLAWEKKLLEDILEVEVNVFSFHNPVANFDELNEWEYAGMINTYATYFAENVEYASDSNGVWRHEPIADVIRGNQQKPLQILTHPVWWTSEITSPHQRIQQEIDGRAGDAMKIYVDLIGKYGRDSIDW